MIKPDTSLKFSKQLQNYMTMATFVAICFPYMGPEFLGIGVKPIWLAFLFISIFIYIQAKTSRTVFLLMLVFIVLDAIGYFVFQIDDPYGATLWVIMIVFIFSSRFFENLFYLQEKIVLLIIYICILFLLLYGLNNMAPGFYEAFLVFLVGQAKLAGRTDFTFLAPESGLGAFGVLLVSYVWFHFCETKSKWHVLIPVAIFMMTGSATSIGLAILWTFYYLLNTNISFRNIGLILFVIFVAATFFTLTSQDFVLARFSAVFNFDIDGASSVAIRARDILRLMDFGAYYSGEWLGPVGIIKAVGYVPGFVLFLLFMIFYYCRPSDLILIAPALIFLPISHPLVWVIIGLQRFSRQKNIGARNSLTPKVMVDI